MKIHTNPQAGSRAASLITVMVICSVLSFSAIGYLALVTQQNSLSARSQIWNMAIAISEAGIEEGLQHINSNTNLTSEDDWTPNGSTYTLTRRFPNGNSYTVEIDAQSPSNPIIISRASIQLSSVAQNAPSAFVASGGINLSPGATESARPISRAVRVTASRSGLFLAAMVAKKGVDLKGNGVKTDSFDSGDLSKSTNGHYDPAKAGDKGDVASNDGIVGVVSVQNANIWGHVRTGKGGTASIGSQGAVGSVAWQVAGNKGIEPGWATEDANFTFPDTTLPYSSGLDPEKDKDIVTAVGVTTNATYVNGSTTYPGNPPVGSTISAIITNTATITTTTYPGSQPGMTTNISYTTTNSYPGAIPGLMTNNAEFTTVKDYPGPQPGLTTNYNGGSGNIKDYTYATSFNYTYPIPTYSYSASTYSYSLYQTVTIYETNRYDNVLVSGNYYYDSAVPLKKVYISGKATLVLPQGLTMSGNDQFVLGPLGSITIYSGGNSITVGSSSSGLNAVENPSGYAGNFVVYCAPSVTDFTLNGNGEFIGVLVAPNADIKMNGGGSAPEDFIGALMVNSVRMNGHFKFHYDEALSRMPATGRFLITSWDEIK